MKNRVTIRIAGEEHVVLTDESAAYMERIARMVEDKLGEAISVPGISRLKATTLAACNLADDYIKAAESADNLRQQVSQYLREADALRRELAESQNMLEELTQPKKK